jgi:hypothetical protein
MSVDQFFSEDGSLISIPARSSKKIEVMKRIAKEFSIGVIYPEKDLNEIIARFHSDTAAIRRYMIEFGIMERNTNSEYWKVATSPE